MAEVKITDNSIWAKHVAGSLQSRLLQMNAGELIELEIDGIVGRWQKMNNYQGSETATPGIKPVGAMAEVWKEKFFARRKNQIVPIREVTTADTYLQGLSATLNEWESTADEEAYRDL